MKLHRHLAGPLLAVSIALGGCAASLETAGNIGQSVSTASPTQARTLAEALQTATLCTDAVDLYVRTGNPSRAALDELNILNDRVHSMLLDLQAANTRGQSLSFAAFNAALQAFNAYYAGVKK
jgi:hypothetical protein